MGTLLYPSEILAKKVLEDLFGKYISITTERFQKVLESKYPEYEWKFLWCSKFLLEQKLEFVKDGKEREWFFNIDGEFIKKFKELSPCSKKELKKHVSFSDSLFEKYSKFTGKYNKENHKLYTYTNTQLDKNSIDLLSEEELKHLIRNNECLKILLDTNSTEHYLIKNFFLFHFKQKRKNRNCI